MQRFWIAGMLAVWICATALCGPAAALAQSWDAAQVMPSQVMPSEEKSVQVNEPAIAQTSSNLASPGTAAPATSASVTSAPAISPSNAPLLFEQNCAGCHVGGGNIIRRGKSLKAKALKRYGMDNQAAIAEIITNGKGNMSAYGEAAKFGAPNRLTIPEIEALADYVLAQAAADWP